VKLTTLYLGGNNFTSGIPELVNMTSLNNLDLGEINLKGEIPPWLGNMQLLQMLYLRNNKLHGTIPPLGKLINLIHLYFVE
jgi:Leucine-rich repeat (LRR) protein